MKPTGWIAALVPVLLLLLLLLLAGCVETNLAARTRWQLEDDLPGARFERETTLHLGRLSMAAVRRIAAWSGEEGEDLDHLRRIRRVSIATYLVHRGPEGGAPPSLGSLERRLGRRGWTPTVRTREAGEATWVYLRSDGSDRIRDLLVIELAADELVVVQVEGRLDRLIAEAIAEDPAGFGDDLGG